MKQKDYKRKRDKKNMKTWNIEALTGYKPITTFYEDFSIADMFGTKAIKDTYKRSFKAYSTDIKYLTELAMALNWKIYEHYQKNNTYAELYNELWQEIDNWIMKNITGEDLQYYLRTTD